MAVFQLSRQTERELLQNTFLSPYDACPSELHLPPWNLGCVSRHWRKVAVGTTALWNEICVRTSATYFDVDLLREQIARAGNRPLKVEFIHCPEVFYRARHISAAQRQAAFHKSALALLVATSERWIDASFSVSLDMFAELAPLSDRIPLLRSLTLDITRGWIMPKTGPINPFYNAPKLRSFTALRIAGMRSAPRVPLSGLVTLRAEWHLRVPFPIPMLPQCQLLESLEIQHNLKKDAAAPWRSPLVLPRLRSYTGSSASPLLWMLLPSLKKVVLLSMRNGADFIEFCRRSSATRIDTLEVRSTSELLTSETTLVSMLEASPSIRDLTIFTSADVPPQIFTALTVSEAGPPPLVPAMYRLALGRPPYDVTAEEFDLLFGDFPPMCSVPGRTRSREDRHGTLLIALIESRKGAVHQCAALDTLKLAGQPLAQETWEALQQLTSGGLKLEVDDCYRTAAFPDQLNERWKARRAASADDSGSLTWILLHSHPSCALHLDAATVKASRGVRVH
ncbi:hypothetical protein C8R43DRAFT_942774 [Mycena crocata]|nr:hypothetical protein C8R43DRAFT_942774 [Mycena crocata]